MKQLVPQAAKIHHCEFLKMLLTTTFQLGYTHHVPKPPRLFSQQLFIDCIDKIFK